MRDWKVVTLQEVMRSTEVPMEMAVKEALGEWKVVTMQEVMEEWKVVTLQKVMGFMEVMMEITVKQALRLTEVKVEMAV